MAVPGVVIAKVAATLLSNEKSRKAIGWIMNCPSLCGQYKSPPYVGIFSFQVEWRSVSGATPVLFWMRSWL